MIYLETGEEIQAEAGAMVIMSPWIELKTEARGGMFAGLRRSVLGGESFFINTFKANAPGEASFAPALPGDIIALEVGSKALFIQSGSYLASQATVAIDTKWGGAKSFFSKE